METRHLKCNSLKANNHCSLQVDSLSCFFDLKRWLLSLWHVQTITIAHGKQLEGHRYLLRKHKGLTGR